MAQSSTIYKVSFNISDLRRHYYQQHNLTLALHPSEQEKRMMLRVLAFCLYADEKMTFTRGLCADDEPELWQLSDSGEILRWIDLGLPTEKRLKLGCSRARQNVLISYNDNACQQWLAKMEPVLTRLDNLTRLHIRDEDFEQLGQLARRNMDLQCTIDEEQIWLSSDEQNICIEIKERQS